jgi:hypothetical protein
MAGITLSINNAILPQRNDEDAVQTGSTRHQLRYSNRLRTQGYRGHNFDYAFFERSNSLVLI